MPNYISDLLKRLQHTPKKQYSPHPYIPFKFGQKGVQQFVPHQIIHLFLVQQKHLHPIRVWFSTLLCSCP